MKTLRTGLLARKTSTFWCTKCFFLLLVRASLTTGCEAQPDLPGEDISVVAKPEKFRVQEIGTSLRQILKSNGHLSLSVPCATTRWRYPLRVPPYRPLVAIFHFVTGLAYLNLEGSDDVLKTLLMDGVLIPLNPRCLINIQNKHLQSLTAQLPNDVRAQARAEGPPKCPPHGPVWLTALGVNNAIWMNLHQFPDWVSVIVTLERLNRVSVHYL